jgi:hypothetical protein
MLNLSNENMDLIGIGRQAFVDPDLLHIASCEFKTCALCNRCFHVLLMKYQLPANCIRNGDYRKLFSMLQGGKIEEIGPDLIEFVVRAYLSLKGDSKREMAEFMARYGDAFNEIFLKRLQNNPADADALFYFDQTRDLEVFYKVQQLRNTIEVGLRPLYDNVLRNIQAGIAISPSQPENTTAVGWTEKHRLDDTYREFVLPLASQISREHNVRLTQYAAADGTTSVDLDNLLQEAKIDAAIFSTDIVINCHIVQDSEDRSLIGIFDDYGHLLQIKYKGRCYLPAVPAERVKHRVGQLNTFTNETQCNELVSRLTAQFNTASKNTFSRSVIIDNTRISFAQRDIFATDYEEAADIVTVLNLFQNFSITSIRSAMVSLGRKMRDGAYIIAGKVSQHYNYNEVSVWQKRGDKLVLLKGNYLVNMSEIDLSNNDNPPSSASPLPTKPPSPDAERVQQAFNRLNAEARKESQLSASVSKLRGTSQNIMEVNKFRFCLPIEVLRNSPDIALALNSTGLLKQRPQDAENIEFELVVTGVMEEDVKLIEGLNRDDIKKALNLPQKFTVSAITEAQIHETAQRFGYDASNPKNRVTIVKDFFSGALAKGDYMAIATDALDTTEKADTLKEELERELKAELAQENISIRVLVRPESGKSMYSLSKIINDWLEAINQGNLSTISRILPIPAPLTPELEKAIRTAWAVLTAA